MLDTSNLKVGARLHMISTNEEVDYVGLTVQGDAMVIRLTGSIQNVNLNDLELVAL